MTTTEGIPEDGSLREEGMVQEERWQEIHRLGAAQVSVSEIARTLALDRKTVRRCLRQAAWRPYQRAATDTVLTPFTGWLTARAPAVDYSARILWQELRQQHGFGGSYETVKRWVRPHREATLRAALTWTRFETPPGEQSQIDWGQAMVTLGGRRVVRHIFVLTLGYSRRAFYEPCEQETLSDLIDAHERAFTYFGGHTREHLYDRPRTVCLGGQGAQLRWNTTFKAFADFWGFEPRVCRPYRAQTKGKVEAGVKYFRRNFLPGRVFRDDRDLRDQLHAWMATVADVRVHGTTHERPCDRFVVEAPTLIGTGSHPRFHVEAQATRVVATDYLVSFETNRYSVPYRLIGQPVQVQRIGAELVIRHRGTVVATHAVAGGKYQVQIQPAHGPGAISRVARQRASTPSEPAGWAPLPDVELRDPTWYDQLAPGGGA
jgi:transposase